MPVANNDITGDKIQTKGSTKAFRDGYPNIDWNKSAREAAEAAEAAAAENTEHDDL